MFYGHANKAQVLLLTQRFDSLYLSFPTAVILYLKLLYLNHFLTR